MLAANWLEHACSGFYDVVAVGTIAFRAEEEIMEQEVRPKAA